MASRARIPRSAGALARCCRPLARLSLRPPRRLARSASSLAQRRRRSADPAAAAPSRMQARALPPLVLLGLLLGGAVYYLAAPPARPTALNDQAFVPYAITAREAISPTSVVLTVAPRVPDPAPPYLEPATSAWRHPLWSVEFKQPEVQIARHYTPLPPRQGRAAPHDGELSFYVRAVGGGEMSTYLCRLAVGQDVWLRGPHAGFDVLPRLGACARVVFLAGGTGVVPGMQVATAVLEASETASVALLWAVRGRQEVQVPPPSPAPAPWWRRWPLRASRGPAPMRADMQEPSHIAARLRDMKAKYGERLDIRVAVDDEGTRFDAADIGRALAAVPLSSSAAPPSSSAAAAGCPLHDQRQHERASEFERPGAATCQCHGPPGEGGCALPGKNLFIVSGPDGFIAHYAGPKAWLGGALTQGALGGVMAELRRRDARLADDWLALKL